MNYAPFLERKTKAAGRVTMLLTFGMGFPVLLLAVYIIPQLVFAADIHVDGHHGISNTSCCPSNSRNSTRPCKTLSLGLECVQNISLTTPVSLIVNEGEYTLTNESRLTVIEQRTGGFTITGNCSTTAVCAVEINCEKGAGLSFIKSDEITFKNLVFSGCGFPNNSTSKSNFSSAESNFQIVTSALYFLLCRTVTISHVTVQDTKGTGVVMYSTVGTNTIAKSNFISNTPPMSSGSDTFTGGGGLYIEFAYCYPGNASCFNGPPNIPDDYNKDSTYSISGCIFARNVANSSKYMNILPQKSNNSAFGRGGGLSLFFKGYATNNIITIEECQLTNNTALWGAGLFVEMQDWSSNNSVSVNYSTLSENRCWFSSIGTQGTNGGGGGGGGGARLAYIFFIDTFVKNNVISFESCTFSNNSTYFGGGTSFYAARDPTEIEPTNSLIFMNTVWQENNATGGSAADVSVWHTVANGSAAVVSFSNCRFEENSGLSVEEQNRAVGKGAMFLDSIPVYFKGENHFTKQ